MKLCVMADHVILLMKGMIFLHEEHPLLIILTTVWLSQRTEMLCVPNAVPRYVMLRQWGKFQIERTTSCVLGRKEASG